MLVSVAILIVFDICGGKAKVYCSANLIVKLVLLCKELSLLLLYSFNDCLQCLGCRYTNEKVDNIKGHYGLIWNECKFADLVGEVSGVFEQMCFL